MRVFILGGTGSIGTAVTAELCRRSHEVMALSRSGAADDKLRRLGANACRGDLRAPAAWAVEATSHDAIIHAAATFSDDMGDVDTHVVSALIEAAKQTRHKPRLIYTGGCWLYGETGNAVATEDSRFDPIPAFSWMVGNAARLLAAPAFSAAILHPAMVYHADGGVFHRFIEPAREGRPMEIWGDRQTRWPLIHRSDLARAYCDLLERPDLTGYFNASAEKGVRVGDIVDAIAQAFGNTLPPVTLSAGDLVLQHGAWAIGPTLDQEMSAEKLRSETGWTPEITDYRRSDLFDELRRRQV